MPGRQCAIHRNGCAGNVPCQTAGKEERQCGALLRVTHPLCRAVGCKKVHSCCRCIAKDAGLGVTGADGVDGDAVFRIIQCCCTGHAHHAELGSAVQCLSTLGYQTRHRCHIDEEAALAVAFQDSLCTVLHPGKDALAVQGEDLLVILYLILMQRCAAHTDARVADNAIQLAVMGNRLVHQFLDGGSLAAIGLDKDSIAALGADAVCHSLALLCTAGGTDHLHTVFAEALGNGPADATACAGDDSNFISDTVEIHHFHKASSIFIFRIHELDLQLLVAYPSLWCYNNTVPQGLQSAASGASGV